MKTIGITRIEGPEGRGSGWMARLTRAGVTTHKWFADGLHGGKLKAQKAAREYRRKLEKTAPPPASTRDRKTSRNTSGKVGVRRAEKVDERRGKAHRYVSYEAYWLDDAGRPCTVGFACKKYGVRRAFALAKLARDHRSTDKAWLEKQRIKSRTA